MTRACPASGRGSPWCARPASAAASGPASATLAVAGDRGGNAQDKGLTLAAAPAQPGGPEPASAPAQLIGEMQGDPGARGADRMADRDRAAVNVHHVGADAEIAHGLDGHGRERLVDLDQV